MSEPVKVVIETRFGYDTGRIEQQISDPLDTREGITLQVMMTRDEQTRRALIALGWTPPRNG